MADTLATARHETATPFSPPRPCDCCGASAWSYLFTEGGVDLGRCTSCGLHSIAQMPSSEQRGEANEDLVIDADIHFQDEQLRHNEFQKYLDALLRFAPPGKWLDIGCGTGTLIRLAQQRGLSVEGIELTQQRASIARRVTGAVIHELPLEQLSLPRAAFSAVTTVNLFSHLRHPSQTLAAIGRVLRPGGILLLVTSEIGPGLKQMHNFHWALGEHLYFLGEATIEQYAQRLGFQVVSRERVWLPDEVYSREWFRLKGRSAIRNAAKKIILYTPGALPVLRRLVFNTRQKDNPVYSSTLILQKRSG